MTFESPLNHNFVNHIANYIERRERDAVISNVCDFMEKYHFDSTSSSPLVKIILDSLVNAIKEGSDIKVDILKEVIVMMNEVQFLNNLDLRDYNAEPPTGNMQYISAYELADAIPRIFYAEIHTFNTRPHELSNPPSSLSTNSQSNLCQLLLLETQAKSSILGHQAVFIPTPNDINFNEINYYSFKIDEY